jgi:replication factor A1
VYILDHDVWKKRATELVGKSAKILHKYHDPATIPSNISQWFGHKFTFVVRILYKKSIRTKDPSFEVLFIKERHEKQKVLPSYNNQSSGTSSTLDDNKDLPELMTISSKNPTGEVSFCTDQQHICKYYYILLIYYIVGVCKVNSISRRTWRHGHW